MVSNHMMTAFLRSMSISFKQLPIVELNVAGRDDCQASNLDKKRLSVLTHSGSIFSIFWCFTFPVV